MESFEIRTNRLVLRPLDVTYLHTVHEYASDYENTKYMVYLPNEGLDETLEFLRNAEQEWKKEKPAFFEFAICIEDKHIGTVSLYLDEDGRSGELGWIIHKQYWKQGIASEAAKALVAFASDELGIHHFFAHCDSENTGSYKVMEKIGMKRTDTHGGRKNRSSDEERIEYKYEMTVDGNDWCS
ncbi:MAG: GNAT family N-acetyltransferase [Lachnospiraceae bacterium]|nr:GNAT family N-acetyltransferase [Lachnospiraceae bacterium]